MKQRNRRTPPKGKASPPRTLRAPSYTVRGAGGTTMPMILSAIQLVRFDGGHIPRVVTDQTEFVAKDCAFTRARLRSGDWIIVDPKTTKKARA